MSAFTVASLAREWKCSDGLVRKLIASGELGCFRLGTLIRIPAEEVARFQATQSSASRGDTQSSGETTPEGTATGLRPLTALERKLRRDGFGRQGTVRIGPLAGSLTPIYPTKKLKASPPPPGSGTLGKP